jgi:hypothetical protein
MEGVGLSAGYLFAGRKEVFSQSVKTTSSVALIIRVGGWRNSGREISPPVFNATTSSIAGNPMMAPQKNVENYRPIGKGRRGFPVNCETLMCF